MERIAHFLLHPELADSPPNDALFQAYRELGFEVDLFAGARGDATHSDSGTLQIEPVEYAGRWLASQVWRSRWRRYAAFSGTCEEPAAVVGALSRLCRRPAIVLADEIRAGAYRGSQPEWWKRLCRAGMRRAALTLVNDPSREALQREYAGLAPSQPVVVYPGGFRKPPPPVDRSDQRARWGLPESALVIGFSGLFGIPNGGHWLVDSLQAIPHLHAVVQPLWANDMTRYLLPRVAGAERMYVEPSRLGWRDAWSQAGAIDIGMAIYLQPGEQFQRMGTSSNRLCMFLAMGAPVIASRQESLRFLEEYDCGALVGDRDEFVAAIGRIAARLDLMQANARRCWREHVRTEERYRGLVAALGRAFA